MELAQELQRQAESKKDLIGDTRQLSVRPVLEAELPKVDAHLVMQINGIGEAPVNPHALRQIGDRLQIPAKYVDRLAENHPDMLAYNINALFGREPEKRMVRLLDNRVRAFLSDSYRIIDNYDVAGIALEAIKEHAAEVTSCEVTEKKLYIKAVVPALKAEIPPPAGAVMGKGHHWFIDQIQGGVTITNSEIGCGAYAMQPSVFTKRCTNWASFADHSFRKAHLGKKNGGDDDQFREFYQDDTKAAEDATLFKKIRDITAAALDGKIFDKIKDELISARGATIERPVAEFIELVQKRFPITQTEGAGILDHLIKGGDFSKYGFHAAVTEYSQTIESYDRATELEELGGDIIQLKPSEWTTIAVAA